MHYEFAALALAAGVAWAGPPGPHRAAPGTAAPSHAGAAFPAPPLVAAPMPVPVPVPAPNVRQAVEQYHPGAMAPPRQLSARERAELRRQLIEYSQPAGRR